MHSKYKTSLSVPFKLASYNTNQVAVLRQRRRKKANDRKINALTVSPYQSTLLLKLNRNRGKCDGNLLSKFYARAKCQKRTDHAFYSLTFRLHVSNLHIRIRNSYCFEHPKDKCLRLRLIMPLSGIHLHYSANSSPSQSHCGTICLFIQLIARNIILINGSK